MSKAGAVVEFTEDQVKEIFRRHATKSGLVQRADLAALLKDLGHPKAALTHFEATLKATHGELDFDQFIRIFQKEYGFIKVEADYSELKRAFNLLDTNRDGFIDAQEMRQNANAMQLQPEEIPIMMKAADTNQDGRVDLQEFLHVIGYDGQPSASSTSSSAKTLPKHR